MQLINHHFNSPEENLACDEYLLLLAESGRVDETLRFWESPDPFVTVGRAGKVYEDCFPERCRDDGVKILRRISGGGTVLQGPGCLNYSIILSYNSNKTFKHIRHCYRYLLGKIADALTLEGHEVRFLPLSDLALNGRKISGNAQARKRNFFLHHGTLLFDLDPGKVTYYIKHPAEEPEYRKERRHKDFITNIPISPDRLKNLIVSIFPEKCDTVNLQGEDIENIGKLVAEKYTQDAWNLAF